MYINVALSKHIRNSRGKELRFNVENIQKTKMSLIRKI